MKKSDLTFWQYFFNSRGKYVSLILIAMAIYSITDQLIQGTGEWYFGLVYAFIGVILCPFATWMNYKKYWV